MDSILSLALSLESNKGVYALMLGSGVSRAALIPTGWEIIEDLVKKVAILRGENCGSDPADWYAKAFGMTPNYSDLLAQIAREPAERRQLLRGYFEATAEERERGLKVPTKAHKEIAWLVSKGYVRLIVTTNFDRLLETAIEAEGIIPTIISSPDAIAGAMPLIHTSCCIVKIHGDYMDTRIRNTSEELTAYDVRLDRLLDRIFDEFGLIVSGWSAEWDIALRTALERCPTRRFSTFWTARGALTPDAEKLIAHRQAQVVPITSADDFFHEVREKVESLEQLAGPHPLSTKVAAATVKRYLVDPRHKIELYDLATREVERVIPLLSPTHFPVQGGFSPQELATRLKRYETLTGILRSIIIVGCYWGEKHHAPIWTRILNRLSNPYGPTGGMILWIKLRLYPALLLMYSGGLAAVAANAFDNLFALLIAPRVRDGSKEYPLVAYINAARSNVMDWDAMWQLPALKNHKTPVSQYLFDVLREPMREFLPDDVAYTQCFDKFEYFLGLAHIDITNNADWAPVGSFIWRNRFMTPEIGVATEIKNESKTGGEEWPPLHAGFFNGSAEQSKQVQASFEAFLARVSPTLAF